MAWGVLPEYFGRVEIIFKKEKMRNIKICKNHQEELKTPLIWTFAFNGAEYWCPYCGAQSGMLEAVCDVEKTKELEDRLEAYKIKSREFLIAMSTTSCVSLLYEGKEIHPSELPDHVKEKNKEIIDTWVYDSENSHKKEKCQE